MLLRLRPLLLVQKLLYDEFSASLSDNSASGFFKLKPWVTADLFIEEAFVSFNGLVTYVLFGFHCIELCMYISNVEGGVRT